MLGGPARKTVRCCRGNNGRLLLLDHPRTSPLVLLALQCSVAAGNTFLGSSRYITSLLRLFCQKYRETRDATAPRPRVFPANECLAAAFFSRLGMQVMQPRLSLRLKAGLRIGRHPVRSTPYGVRCSILSQKSQLHNVNEGGNLIAGSSNPLISPFSGSAI